MRRQVIVEIDAAMARELERIAPAATRRRSAFIRAALRRALDDWAERRMAQAYRALPDVDPAFFEARVWEPQPYPPKRRRGRP